ALHSEPEQAPPSLLICRGGLVSSSESLDELFDRRRAAESDLAPVEPARHRGGVGRISKGIFTVDADGWRSPHSKTVGLLTRADLPFADNRSQPPLGQRTVHMVAGETPVRTLGDIEQVDHHGATVR